MELIERLDRYVATLFLSLFLFACTVAGLPPPPPSRPLSSRTVSLFFRIFDNKQRRDIGAANFSRSRCLVRENLQRLARQLY